MTRDPQEIIASALDAFAENDMPVIDLTEPKTFCVAALLAIIFGIIIGFGYNVVFTSVDCTNPAFQKAICLPNQYADHKLAIVIVTVIAGVLTGIAPFVIRKFMIHEREVQEQEEQE